MPTAFVQSEEVEVCGFALNHAQIQHCPGGMQQQAGSHPGLQLSEMSSGRVGPNGQRLHNSQEGEAMADDPLRQHARHGGHQRLRHVAHEASKLGRRTDGLPKTSLLEGLGHRAAATPHPIPCIGESSRSHAAIHQKSTTLLLVRGNG